MAITPPAKNYINGTGVGLTIFLCACTAVVIWFEVRNAIPQENREFVTYIAGWLTAKLSTVIDFCYGTSSGSRTQQESIAALVNTNAQAQAALTPNVPDITIPPGGTATVSATEEVKQ